MVETTTSRSEIVLVEGATPPPAVETLSDAELDEAIVQVTHGLVAGWRHTLDQGWLLGRYLAEKKRRLPYGEWLTYVKTTLPIAERQTRYLMGLGSADRQFIAALPVGTTVTDAVKAWERIQRQPRPLPEPSSGDDDDDEVEAPRLLLRYMPPEMSVAEVMTSIITTLVEDVDRALDVTYGEGLFWDGSWSGRVVAHDLDETRALDGVMDFTNLQYDDASWPLVVIDPPHNADAGENSIMGQRYGTVKGQAELEQLIIDGVRECWRVCEKALIVKITDQTHGQVFNDMCMVVCDALGIWPYEKVHHVREYPLVPNNQTEHYSALSNGSTYLVFRKGGERHVSHRRKD